jgi:hypothetical protein
MSVSIEPTESTTSQLIQRRVTSFFEFGLSSPPWMAYTFAERLRLQHYKLTIPIRICPTSFTN